jgi:hypothetical protein
VAVCEEIGSIREFPGLSVDLADDEYRGQIISFARTAKELFDGIEKTFEDDWERSCYEEFWREYDTRLLRATGQPVA